MNIRVGELFKQVADLSEEDRAALAGLLIESLEFEREADAAWIEKIERRVAELDQGLSRLFPGKC